MVCYLPARDWNVKQFPFENGASSQPEQFARVLG